MVYTNAYSNQDSEQGDTINYELDDRTWRSLGPGHFRIHDDVFIKKGELQNIRGDNGLVTERAEEFFKVHTIDSNMEFIKEDDSILYTATVRLDKEQIVTRAYHYGLTRMVSELFSVAGTIYGVIWALA
jgi:hypothetical protein